MFPDGGDPFFGEIQEVYDEIGEGLPPGNHWPRPGELREQGPEIEASGLFTVAGIRHYDWERVYDAEGYIGLLRTFSGHMRRVAETGSTARSGPAWPAARTTRSGGTGEPSCTWRAAATDPARAAPAVRRWSAAGVVPVGLPVVQSAAGPPRPARGGRAHNLLAPQHQGAQRHSHPQEPQPAAGPAENPDHERAQADREPGSPGCPPRGGREPGPDRAGQPDGGRGDSGRPAGPRAGLPGSCCRSAPGRSVMSWSSSPVVRAA